MAFYDFIQDIQIWGLICYLAWEQMLAAVVVGFILGRLSK